MVDVVTSSALTAVALQWYTRVKYMTGRVFPTNLLQSVEAAAAE